MRKVGLVFLLIVALVLAGCGGSKKKSPSGGSPSATAFVPTSLPPTWTASPPGFVASPTFTVSPAAAATERPGGTPLPPTWTPGVRPTMTLRHTPTEIPPTLPPAPTWTPQTWTPQPDYCSSLQITSPDARITVGQPVDAKWTAVPTITSYELTVRNPNGEIAFQQVVSGTSFTLPGTIFVSAGGYSWEIWPLDAQGNQICFPASRDIIVSF